MTYQPFLPEVAAGSIEPRHAVVAHRSHLKTTRIIAGKVTGINHATKTATIVPNAGESFTHGYDHVVFTAGSVSRTFPIPGVADEAIGLKTIEEAVAVRDRILSNFDRAAQLPAGAERDRLLTVVVVGGGFAGIEIFSELRSLASDLIKSYPELEFADTHFHLIEAMGRIMPEVSLKTSYWVLKNLDERGATVHLDTQLKSAKDGVIELSTGESFASDLIIWTAGVMAHPSLKNTDFPLDERGRLRLRADLRVEGEDGILEGAWGAGDAAACPDLSGGGVGGFCVPNAQHAVRQGKLLAKNLVAALRGEGPTGSTWACSSPASLLLRAGRRLLLTVVTTVWQCLPSSASSVLSAAGGTTFGWDATLLLSKLARPLGWPSKNSLLAPSNFCGFVKGRPEGLPFTLLPLHYPPP
jgi:NADH dehydrogenase